MYIPFVLFQKLNKIIKYEKLSNSCKKIELNSISKEDLTKLEDYLKAINKEKILLYEGNIAYLKMELDEYHSMIQYTKLDHILFNSDDRSLIIYIYLFIKKSFVSINHIKSLFGLSKNTILSDIKNLNRMLEPYHIVVEYHKMEGYIIHSELKNKRDFLRNIIDTYDSVIMEFIILKLKNEWNITSSLEKELIFIFKKYEIDIEKISFKKILNLFLLIGLVEDRGKIEYTDRQIQEIKKININEIASEICRCLFQEEIEFEKIFISSHLIIFTNFYNFTYYDDNLKNITSNIVERSQEKYFIKYKNINEFKFNFYTHIIGAFFRILFDIKIKNNTVDELKDEYKFLFHITKDLVKPLEDYLGKEIYDIELNFFALYFGSEILNTNINMKNKKVKALIICPDGISSSLILRKQLEQLFSEVEFTNKSSYEVNYNNIEQYDIIFSTKEKLNGVDNHNIYYLNTILDSNEKSNLIEYMVTNFGICYRVNVSVDDIMDLIVKDTNINQKNLLKIREILVKSIYNKPITQDRNTKELMLKNLVSFDSIMLDIDAENIEEAVYKSSCIHIQKGTIHIQYVENVIEKMAEFPNSCYLTRYFIMPHTYDPDNVYDVGISFLRLKKELYLNGKEELPVKFIIFLATNNHYDHLYALNELLHILNDSEKREILLHGNYRHILKLLYG